MKQTLSFAAAACFALVVGCRNGSDPSPAFAIEARPMGAAGYVPGTPIPLIAGEVNQVDFAVQYRRNERVPAKLKYNVKLSAPADLTATNIDGKSTWDREADLDAAAAGMKLGQTLKVRVDPAATGDRDITVAVTPEGGVPALFVVRCKVGR